MIKYKDWNYVPDPVVIEKKKDKSFLPLPIVKYKPVKYILDEETGEYIANGDQPTPYLDLTTDLDAYIQASAPLCDLKAIYARSVAARDPSLLIAKEGAYGDFVNMPTNIYEADSMSLNQLKKFDESYEKLPDDLKQVFGSKHEFVSAVLNDRLNDYLIKVNSVLNSDVEKVGE